jgi:hypothetical protein
MGMAGRASLPWRGGRQFEIALEKNVSTAR